MMSLQTDENDMFDLLQANASLCGEPPDRSQTFLPGKPNIYKDFISNSLFLKDLGVFPR